MKKLVVIIPTLNEEKTIGRTIKSVMNNVKRIKDYDVSILVVDSNSSDKTQFIVGKLTERYLIGQINLLVINKKGLGLALTKGLKYSVRKLNADVVATLDSDGSHDPRELPLMVLKMNKSHADIVLGSRYVKAGGVSNWNLKRRMLSKCGNLYLKAVTGIFKVSDYTGNYRLIKAEVVERMSSKPSFKIEDWSFLALFVFESIASGFKVVEHPIIFSERVGGESKMDSKSYSKKLLKVALNFRKREIISYLHKTKADLSLISRKLLYRI